MKNKLIRLLGIIALSLLVQRGFAADATTELKMLVAKVKTDLATGKNTESDLADDLKQFDVLLRPQSSPEETRLTGTEFGKSDLRQSISRSGPPNAGDIATAKRIWQNINILPSKISRRSAGERIRARKPSRQCQLAAAGHIFLFRELSANSSASGWRGSSGRGLAAG